MGSPPAVRRGTMATSAAAWAARRSDSSPRGAMWIRAATPAAVARASSAVASEWVATRSRASGRVRRHVRQCLHHVLPPLVGIQVARVQCHGGAGGQSQGAACRGPLPCPQGRRHGPRHHQRSRSHPVGPLHVPRQGRGDGGHRVHAPREEPLEAVSQPVPRLGPVTREVRGQLRPQRRVGHEDPRVHARRHRRRAGLHVVRHHHHARASAAKAPKGPRHLRVQHELAHRRARAQRAHRDRIAQPVPTHGERMGAFVPVAVGEQLGGAAGRREGFHHAPHRRLGPLHRREGHGPGMQRPGRGHHSMYPRARSLASTRASSPPRGGFGAGARGSDAPPPAAASSASHRTRPDISGGTTTPMRARRVAVTSAMWASMAPTGCTRGPAAT
jgi:hypothetical protein